jgi:hypothetical protein
MVALVIYTWMAPPCSTLLRPLLTEVPHGFPHSLQTTAGIVPQLEHCRLFPRSFLFISDVSSYHLKLYTLRNGRIKAKLSQGLTN